MIRAFWLGLVAVMCLAASPAAAKSDLFTDTAPLKLIITAPFPALVRAAPTSINPFAASLVVTEGSGSAQTLAIQVSARGLTRRVAGVCEFPPILLRFDKADDQDTVFKGQKKLKLVTYCKKPTDYEQRIVIESLAYRLYNLVTPISYRVRPAEVTYRTSETDAGITRFGYLIEDEKALAKRNTLQELKVKTHEIAATQLDPRAATRATLFEYMIGNLDWEFLSSTPGTECCHNSRLFAAPDSKPATAKAVVPVPYDFDYSGLVDAPYAVPPSNLPVHTITARYYRGYCPTKGEIPAVIAEYRSLRPQMTALINDEPRLTPGFRGKAVRYLDSFFTLLDDPAKVDSEITRHCR